LECGDSSSLSFSLPDPATKTLSIAQHETEIQSGDESPHSKGVYADGQPAVYAQLRVGTMPVATAGAALESQLAGDA
jgi:hypothetical protein